MFHPWCLCIAFAALMAPTSTPAQETHRLLVGYADVDISPPVGTSMPGYFRDRKSTGTLDPIRSRVLYLATGDESLAIVQCDLIGMAAPTVRRIREAVARSVKPGPLQVWIHCSHTHTGGFIPRAGTFTTDAEKIFPKLYEGVLDERWLNRVVEGIVDAVRRARASAETEQRLWLHTGREATVAHYRRYVMKDGSVRTNPGRNNPNVVRPNGEIDPRVHVLRFEDRKIAVVFYGLHPDCVGGAQISADYPGHLCELLGHALGTGWQVVFLNTACGNINHVDINDAKQRSGPEESRRIGERLARAALEAMKDGSRIPTSPLRLRTREVTSTLRRPPDADVREAEALLRNEGKPGQNPRGFNEIFAPAALVLARTQDREHRAEIAALRIGSFGLAFLPGEIFVELAREIEEASPFRPTRTVGLTNGSMGYIPTRRGHAEGGYEAGYRSARYVPDTGHVWARAAAELLNEMGR